jgi:hypothetical protein
MKFMARHQSFSMRSRIPFWVRWLLPIGLLLACGVIWFGMQQGANRVVDSLRWFGVVRYASMSVGIGGAIELHDFQLASYGAQEPDKLRAARIRIQTPGLIWLLTRSLDSAKASVGLAKYLGISTVNKLQNLGDLPQAFPRVSRLAIDIEDLSVGPSVANFGDLRWIGLNSAAAMDSVGCDMDQAFNKVDLKAMSLTEALTNAHLSFEATAVDQARLLLTIEREGSSSAELNMLVRLDDAKGILDTDWSTIAPMERTWNIIDQGFVTARNRYCASRLGIGREGYVERHLSVVKRQLMNVGAVPTAELESAYRRYILRGGALTWTSRPTLTVPGEQLAKYSLAERLKVLNATLESVRGRAVPFQFDIVAQPTPNPQGGIADLAPENVNSGPVSADPTASIDAAAANALPPKPGEVPPSATLDPIDKPTPSTSSLSQQQPVSTPPSSNSPLNTGNTNTDSNSEPAAIANPVISPNITPSPQSNGAVTSSDSTELSGNPGVKIGQDSVGVQGDGAFESGVLASQWQSKLGTALVYEDLEKLVGQKILVRSIFGTVREGILEEYNRISIRLRLSVRDGDLSVIMAKKTIKKVELRDTRSVAIEQPADATPLIQ